MLILILTVASTFYAVTVNLISKQIKNLSAGTFQIEFVEHKNKKPSCTIYWSTLKKIVLNGIVTNFAQCSG